MLLIRCGISNLIVRSLSYSFYFSRVRMHCPLKWMHLSWFLKYLIFFKKRILLLDGFEDSSMDKENIKNRILFRQIVYSPHLSKTRCSNQFNFIKLHLSNILRSRSGFDSEFQKAAHPIPNSTSPVVQTCAVLLPVGLVWSRISNFEAQISLSVTAGRERENGFEKPLRHSGGKAFA